MRRAAPPKSPGWLKRAAELGLLPAQTNLAAIAYAQGDQVGSLRLLRTAAALAHDLDVLSRLANIGSFTTSTINFYSVATKHR